MYPDEYSDSVAKELTEIINSSQTEDEILAEVHRRREPRYYREVFRKTCERKGLSEETRLKMFEHLDKYGYSRFNFRLNNLMDIVNHCRSEEEMLEAMEKRKHLGHDRAILLGVMMDKNLSEYTQQEIAKIIRNAYFKSGSEGADEKAKEIMEIANGYETEEEILEKAKEIKDEVIIQVMTEKGIVSMTPDQYSKYEKKQRRQLF